MEIKQIHPEYKSDKEKDTAAEEAVMACLVAIRQITEMEEASVDT